MSPAQDVDPLTRVLQDESVAETDEEREVRIRREREAKRVSDNIDEDLREEKAQIRRTRPVKILLLGQSESGKSTALKNFQMIHTPQAWAAELSSWRSIIQLNLIRSVRYMLEALPNPPPEDSPNILYLQTRLAPLLQVEDSLIHKLSPEEDRERIRLPKLREVSVNALTSWKGKARKGDEDDEAAAIMRIISARREDIRALWSDQEVRELLKRKKMRMEDFPGFFLDDLDRIASEDYTPSDDDVLRARLKTVGVTEYRFTRETTNVAGSDWRIYDVGGSRSQRPAWAPYFSDVDAIIFLAPISAFDQVLVEDASVNRLEDTVLLWKSLCSNMLLEKCNIILFLNKIDLLDRKLSSGVRFSKYVPSFGDRKNTKDEATAYLKRKLEMIFREKSPKPRPFHCHLTSLTDTVTTAKVIASVADMILKSNLKDSNLV